MSMKKYAAIVFIGRFQPLHEGHLRTISLALEQGERLVIVLGSYKRASSLENPWTAQERQSMILSCLSEPEKKRVSFVPIADELYRPQAWVDNVMEGVGRLVLPSETVALIGHHKDASSYYLKNFPNWPLIETGNYGKLNSTNLREAYFCTGFYEDKNLPQPVRSYLEEYQKTETFSLLREEFLFQKSTSKIDILDHALCLCEKTFLVGRRRQCPGKNTLALPQIIDYQKYKDFFVRSQEFQDSVKNSPEAQISRVFLYQFSQENRPQNLNGDENFWITREEWEALEPQFFSNHYQKIKFVLENF